MVEDNTDRQVTNVNPFLYRGYYYDWEIGMYYLQSRYYDPTIGRFINSDDSMFLGANGNVASYNLFAYCQNDVVNMMDVYGFVPVKITQLSFKKQTITTTFEMTFTGSQLATTVFLTAAVIDIICLIITAATGGSAAIVALPIWGIVTTIAGVAVYLLDKYRANQKYKVTVTVKLHLYKVRILWRTYYGANYSGLKVKIKKV